MEDNLMFYGAMPKEEMDILRGQLEKIMRERTTSIMRLSFDIGISHPTLKRFIMGDGKFGMKTLNKIEKFVYKD